VQENVFDRNPALFGGGLSDFVRSGNLDHYVAEIMAARPA
jgi:hypothetical protein